MTTGPADPVYMLLRYLTLPVVAVTTSADGRANGMIANSAQRASLLPAKPRVSFYALKRNLSHDLIYASGLFAVHLLGADQWALIERLGLASGRDRDKLDGLELLAGETGCPVIAGTAAAFECRVVNVMDAGPYTFFLGDVVAVHPGRAGPLMTSDRFRDYAPPELKRAYEERLAAVQRLLAEESQDVVLPAYPGAVVGP